MVYINKSEPLIRYILIIIFILPTRPLFAQSYNNTNHFRDYMHIPLIGNRIIKCPFEEDLKELDNFTINSNYSSKTGKHSGSLSITGISIDTVNKVVIKVSCSISFLNNKLNEYAIKRYSFYENNTLVDSISLLIKYDLDIATSARFYYKHGIDDKGFRRIVITQNNPYSIKDEYFMGLLYNYELDEYSKPKIIIE